MKTLLITDIPPCKNYTAGIVLDQLCRLLPPGSIACSAVIDPFVIDARLSPDLDLPIQYLEKPNETWTKHKTRPSSLNGATSFSGELWNELFKLPALAKKIVNFGKSFQADRLWFALQGQTEIRLVKLVSDRLKIPYSIQLWDPIYYWLDFHNVDKLTQNRINKEFDSALRNCHTFGAASWYMAEQYSKQHGANAVSLMPCIDTSFFATPKQKIENKTEFIIAGAGKIYPDEVWDSLISALESVNWEIATRKIKINMLTRKVPRRFANYPQIESSGWHSQEDAISLLSTADLLYCPYWFDQYYKEVTRLSFPGKVPTFLAAGKPVMYHGPEYGSPARFFRENTDSGISCHSMESDEIIRVIKEVITDRELNVRLSENGRATFDKYFTMKTMRKNFARFLDIDIGDLVDERR